MFLLPRRYLTKNIKADLKKKMVFVGGARQVGKTTLAQSLIKKFHDKHPAYLNWDSDEDRKKIKTRQFVRKSLGLPGPQISNAMGII